MAAANVPPQTLAEELADHLSCTICMEDFKEPKSLPCLHNFCKHCLIGWIESKGSQHSFQCPICRQEMVLPAGGVDAMITNFFVMNLQDTIGTHITDRHCDVCFSYKEGSTVTATSRCIQCHDYLCQECSLGHTRSKFTHDHQVIPLADLASADVQAALRSSQEVKCPAHPDEPVKYFCKLDQVPVCRDCIALDHHGHKNESLKDAADRYKKSLTSHIDKLQNFAGNYQENLQVIQNYKTKFNETSTNVEQDIKIWADDTCKKVREHEKKLLAELDAKTKLENKSTLAIQDETELKLVKLCSTIETGSRVMKHGKDAEILFLQSQMTERMNQIEDEGVLPPFKTNTNITLQSNNLDFNGTKLLTEKIDIIQPNQEDTPKKYISRQPRSATVLEKVQLLHTFNIKTQTDKEDCKPFGATVLSNNHIVITDGQPEGRSNNKIKLFDIRGILKWEATVAKPWNVSVMPDSNVMMSKSNTPCIDILHPNTGNMLRNIKTKVNCAYPGLAVYQNRLVQTDSDKKCFYICDLDGTVQNTVQNKHFQHPIYASCSNNGNIVISDNSAHCAFLYSPTCELLSTYGTPGIPVEGPGTLNCPQGVCTDSSNHILIVDCLNKKVHLLTPEAKFIKYLLTSEDLEDKYPQAVAITPQGNLVVTLDDNIAKVFKYIID